MIFSYGILVSEKDVKETMSKEIDIEYYHQLALQKQKEHRKFL